MIKDLYKNAKEVSQVLKILSNPDRLAILCYIDNDEKNVNSIVEHTEISQPQVSQYLAQMKKNNILESNRQWREILYKISDKKILNILQSLKKIYCD